MRPSPTLLQQDRRSAPDLTRPLSKEGGAEAQKRSDGGEEQDIVSGRRSFAFSGDISSNNFLTRSCRLQMSPPFGAWSYFNRHTVFRLLFFAALRGMRDLSSSLTRD